MIGPVTSDMKRTNNGRLIARKNLAALLRRYDRTNSLDSRPFDLIFMRSRKPKSEIPPELKTTLSIIGEIVQEQLRDKRRDDDKMVPEDPGSGDGGG